MVNMANLRPTTLVEMFAIIDHVPAPYLQKRPRTRVVKRVVGTVWNVLEASLLRHAVSLLPMKTVYYTMEPVCYASPTL